MRISAIFRWLLPILLFAASCWTAKLTLFNWWAAGGPPVLNPQPFEDRGNFFAIVTLLLFAGAAILSAFNLKRPRP